MIYKNYEIEKIKHNGLYSCFVFNHGYLKADTLKGIKKLINEKIKGQ